MARHAAFVLALATFLPLTASADTYLLMAEEKGCMWCARWNEEIAHIYPKTKEGQALPPIAHEITEVTGILHKDAIVSMARMGPGTAATDFFICIGDQPELDYGGKRNPDGQGFAAFGKVLEGMDVVRAIHQQPVDKQRLAPPIPIHRVALQDP